MKWKDLSSGQNVEAYDESSKGTVKYRVVVMMKPSHNGASFITCQTYFEKPQSEANWAANIPVNNYVFSENYTLPNLTVYCKY